MALLASRQRLTETKRPAACSRGAFGPNIQVIQTAYPDNDPGTAVRQKHLQHRNGYSYWPWRLLPPTKVQ